MADPAVVADDVRAIADLLHEMEGLLDGVFAKGAQLAGALNAARAKRSLSRVIGHQVDAAVARAMGLSSEAMTNTIEAHRCLDKLAPKFGIEPSMYGDGSKDPDITQPSGQLRVAG